MPARTLAKRKRPAKKVYRAKRKFIKRVHREGIKPVVLPHSIPARLMMKQTYESIFNISATNPSIAYAVFRTASAYDPEYTYSNMTVSSASSNGQPGWWDKVSPWYRAYIIRGCKIYLNITPNSTEVLTVQYACSSSADGLLTTTVDWQQLGAAYSGSALIGTSSAKSFNRKIYVDNYKVQGLSNLSSKLLQANPLVNTVGGSPVLGPYFQFKVEAADGSGTYTGVAKVRMVFYLELFDKKLLQGVDA